MMTRTSMMKKTGRNDSVAFLRHLAQALRIIERYIIANSAITYGFAITVQTVSKVV